MKKIRLFVRAFFGFSRMETNGFLILLPMIVLILFSDTIYQSFRNPPPLLVYDRTDSLLAWIYSRKPTEIVALDTVTFHRFDPNQLSGEGFQALGLRESLTRRIIRYREKGGKFRRPEDVQRIYGMDSAWFMKARSWMDFPRPEWVANRQVVKQKRIIRSDINTADTLQLQDVYGIGPTLARRIVTFRDRLGGFVSMDQLREVYGLDSVVVERVKKQFSILLHFEPRKLDLNTARIEDFLRHPYINRRQAQAIVAYRSQHSRIDSTGQLRNIPTIDTTWTRKMKPYLFVLPLAERR